MQLDRLAAPRYVATSAPDPNPWWTVDTPRMLISEGSVDLRWRTHASAPWRQAGAIASMQVHATTDEREARAAHRAFAQVLPGITALYDFDGTWIVDPQQVWDKDASTKRHLPDRFVPSLQDAETGALVAQAQRRSPFLVGVRDASHGVTWPAPPPSDPDDPWSQPLPTARGRFSTPTPIDVDRPALPSVATIDGPIARVEYTNPYDSSRRSVTSLYVDEFQAAWMGSDPHAAVSGARALASAVSMEVAVWREADGTYWLFPVYGRDRHLPAQTIGAANAIMRTPHEGLQAIIGAGAAFDPHGLVSFSGPDDPDTGHDSYLQPGDPRIGS